MNGSPRKRALEYASASSGHQAETNTTNSTTGQHEAAYRVTRNRWTGTDQQAQSIAQDIAVRLRIAPNNFNKTLYAGRAQRPTWEREHDALRHERAAIEREYEDLKERKYRA